MAAEPIEVPENYVGGGSYPVEFEEPGGMLQNEVCSKLLKKDSQLYRRCLSVREVLLKKYPGEITDPPRMPLHIELASHERYKALRQAAKETVWDRMPVVNGRDVHTAAEDLELFGRALGFMGPFVPGYGYAHITVAYFPKEDEDKKPLREHPPPPIEAGYWLHLTDGEYKQQQQRLAEPKSNDV